MVAAAELRVRWSEPNRIRLVREVRTWLTGQGPRPIDLELTNGRVDLRGIPLTASPMTIGDKDDPNAGVTWNALDLSGAQLDHLRFFAGTITNCRFDNASMFGLRLWGTTVTDSSFRRTDLRSSAPGTGAWNGLRNTWRRVAFDRANLRDVQITGAILDHCSFDRTSKLLRLVDCEISECIFHGELNTLLIDGRGHQYPVDPSKLSADFTDSTLKDSYILGYRLDKVQLPQQDSLVVIHRWPSTLQKAADWLQRNGASEPEQRLGGVFEIRLTSPGENAAGTDYCYDVEGYGDPDITQAAIRAIEHAQGSLR